MNIEKHINEQMKQKDYEEAMIDLEYKRVPWFIHSEHLLDNTIYYLFLNGKVDAKLGPAFLFRLSVIHLQATLSYISFVHLHQS